MNFMIVLIAAALVGIAVSSLGVMLVGRFRFDAKIRRIKTALRSESGSEELFSFEMLEGLPPAASRYLSHTIRPGTVLARRVEIEIGRSLRDARGSCGSPGCGSADSCSYPVRILITGEKAEFDSA